MKNILKALLKDQEGYGTVELLLIVAGIGLLATALFQSMQDNLVDGADSTTNKVTKGVNTLIDGWIPQP